MKNLKIIEPAQKHKDKTAQVRLNELPDAAEGMDQVSLNRVRRYFQLYGYFIGIHPLLAAKLVNQLLLWSKVIEGFVNKTVVFL